MAVRVSSPSEEGGGERERDVVRGSAVCDFSEKRERTPQGKQSVRPVSASEE